MEPTHYFVCLFCFVFNKESSEIASPLFQKIRIENFALLLLPGCSIELEMEFRLVLVQGRFSTKIITELEQQLYLVWRLYYGSCMRETEVLFGRHITIYECICNMILLPLWDYWYFVLSFWKAIHFASQGQKRSRLKCQNTFA